MFVKITETVFHDTRNAKRVTRTLIEKLNISRTTSSPYISLRRPFYPFQWLPSTPKVSTYKLFTATYESLWGHFRQNDDLEYNI